MVCFIFQVFVCTGENQYRKPSTLMWEHFEQHCNGGVKVRETTQKKSHISANGFHIMNISQTKDSFVLKFKIA